MLFTFATITLALRIAGSLTLSQTPDPAPRELLSAARALTPAEATVVLAGSRAALVGKTFRVVPPGIDDWLAVLMGPDGPKVTRTVLRTEGGSVGGIRIGSPDPVTVTHWQDERTLLTEYTGMPARRCDGRAERGDLVIVYSRRRPNDPWTVSARTRDARDLVPGLSPPFEVQPDLEPSVRDRRRQLQGRMTHGFGAPWTEPPVPHPAGRPPLIGDPIPNVTGDPPPGAPSVVEARQLLWIAVETLLPLRWEVSRRGHTIHAFDFVYESIDLRRPEGLSVPDCVR